eukprot:GDKH01005299.1.p1 GENE.GDKH01005299.1~~GDKH01005299.1.p1  ORF type:complete len:304 (-),score=69.51 GDKH01005299.1:232-1143(-)
MNPTVSSILATLRVAQEYIYNLPVPTVVSRWIDFLGLCFTLFVRFFAISSLAATDLDKCARPAKTLILYDFEACPYCKKVREALCILDLDYIAYPCPRTTYSADNASEGSRFRPEAVKVGGKAMFPLLVDENTNKKMYQSDEIVKYLFETYGAKCTPPALYTFVTSYPTFNTISLFLSGISRLLPQHGTRAIPSRRPAQLLELYGHENSPYVKRVRELLCSLEIPYVMRTLCQRSAKRKALHEKYGRQTEWYRQRVGMFKIPFLVDPNTKREMFESEAILQYIRETYQTADAPIDPKLVKKTG